MPQIDILTFGPASISTFFAFIIGLIFDAYPHVSFL